MQKSKFKIRNKPGLQSNKNGFSLVEVLIAIGILAACLIPMMNAFSVALFMRGEKEEITRSIFLCEKKMEKARASLEYNFLAPITTEGSFSNDGFPDYRFKVELNDVITGKTKAIRGTVWRDRNGNGEIDDEEKPVVFGSLVANRG